MEQASPIGHRGHAWPAQCPRDASTVSPNVCCWPVKNKLFSLHWPSQASSNDARSPTNCGPNNTNSRVLIYSAHIQSTTDHPSIHPTWTLIITLQYRFHLFQLEPEPACPTTIRTNEMLKFVGLSHSLQATNIETNSRKLSFSSKRKHKFQANFPSRHCQSTECNNNLLVLGGWHLGPKYRLPISVPPTLLLLLCRFLCRIVMVTIQLDHNTLPSADRTPFTTRKKFQFKILNEIQQI